MTAVILEFEVDATMLA